MRRTFCIGGLLVLTAFAVSAGDGGLKFTGKQDEVHKFKLAAKFQLEHQDEVNLSSDVTAKVTNVDAAGLVTVQLVTSNRKTLVGTVDVPTGASPSLSKVFRPDGSLAELHGEGATPEAYRLETLMSVKLPDSPMKVDKTWTWNVPADPKTGVVKSTIDYKVIGEDSVAGVAAWKLSRTTKELSGDAPASDVGTVWVSKMDGMIVKYSDAWTNTPISHATQAVSATLTYELQP